MSIDREPALPRVLNRPAEVDTPCLLLDLDALERNIDTMAEFVASCGVRLRAHAKTHKSPDIAALQVERGAIGICCQKVSEAEAMVAGGVRDVLVSNEIVSPRMIDRLTALARRARVLVCADDAGNVVQLDASAGRAGVQLEVLVEIDVGAGRCGVAPGRAALALAQQIAASTHLRYAGLQAYHGPAQHIRDFHARRQAIAAATAATAETVALLETGRSELRYRRWRGATGSYRFDAVSGVYNELQCGSYVFMDAHYQRVLQENGRALADFDNSLFIYTTVMSKTRPGWRSATPGSRPRAWIRACRGYSAATISNTPAPVTNTA